MFHSYSDTPEGGIHIQYYAYPEVFGEKVRALGERGRPRDLYYVINLFRNDNLPATSVILDVLLKKCAYKGIGNPGMDDMGNYEEAMKTNWEPMLAHQLPSLPSLDVYWNALPEFFDWLGGKVRRERVSLGAVSGEGHVYRPVYGRLGLRAQSGSSLEIIRFAAGNRLCVDLDYTDNQGRRSSRVIEPYSLRRAKNGNVLLYAVRAEDGQIRAYKITQINNASITNQVFVPRYLVELSPEVTGSSDILSTGTQESLGLPRTVRRLAVRRGGSASRRRSIGFSSGPTYVYRCPYCDKTFKHKTQSPTLRAHKTKDGLPCPGRTGYYEDII